MDKFGWEGPLGGLRKPGEVLEQFPFEIGLDVRMCPYLDYIIMPGGPGLSDSTEWLNVTALFPAHSIWLSIQPAALSVSAALLLGDMQVSLKCGSSEKLTKVEEPSRCEYIATLATPAACTPSEAQAVQDQLAALNQELEGDHSEL